MTKSRKVSNQTVTIDQRERRVGRLRNERLVEIAVKAAGVLGSLADVQRWLVTPAIGLDGRRLIDLISMSAGTEAVRKHLIRMDHASTIDAASADVLSIVTAAFIGNPCHSTCTLLASCGGDALNMFTREQLKRALQKRSRPG